MAKKKSLSKCVGDVAVLLQKLVRLKAADSEGYITCITCGEKKHWKNADGAHYISRTWTATKIDETNIHASCKRCNMLDDVFVRDAYTEYMNDMYGKDYVQDLKDRARKPHKHDRGELEQLTKEYKAQIKELERGL